MRPPVLFRGMDVGSPVQGTRFSITLLVLCIPRRDFVIVVTSTSAQFFFRPAAAQPVHCVRPYEDLKDPSRRGRAYDYSHLRVAQRVLLAAGERLGLLTSGF